MSATGGFYCLAMFPLVPLLQNIPSILYFSLVLVQYMIQYTLCLINQIGSYCKGANIYRISTEGFVIIFSCGLMLKISHKLQTDN